MARRVHSDAFDRSILTASPGRAADLLTVQARAARDFPAGRSARHLRRLMRDHLDQLAPIFLTVASETGEPVTGLLARVLRRRADPVLARRLAEAIREPVSALVEVGIACWQVIVRATLAEDPAGEDFPLRLTQDVAELVTWLHLAGRPAGAVAIIRRALALLRRHDLPRPLGLMSQYAGLLISLGRFAEAERRLREVLAIAEREQVSPIAMVDDWINLAHALSEQNDPEAALQASRHALHLLLRSRETDDDESRFLPDALTNHAHYLLDAGRPRAAAAAIRHVVTLVDRKAARAPDLHRPALVDALLNASRVLVSVGARNEALACSRRAVSHARHLTGNAAEQHVLSLLNFAADLEQLGEPEFAFQQARRAVDLARTLAKGGGGASTKLVCNALSTLCHVALKAERLEKGRAAGLEALDLLQTLPPKTADMERIELLPNLADVFAGLGERTRAADLAQQAYDLVRRHEVTERLSLDLRIGIRDVFAKYLEGDEGSRQAITVLEEAIAIGRSELGRTPGLISDALVHPLIHLSQALAEIGDFNGALPVAQEGVALARALAEHSAEWAANELPIALHTLARLHWLRQEWGKASALAGEMVTLARTVVAASEEDLSLLHDLAAALEFAALVDNAAGNFEMALTGINEAMALYRRLTDHVGPGYLGDFGNGLHNAATIAFSAGDLAAAIDFQRQAGDTLSRLVEADPEALRLAAGGLCNLAIYLTMDGSLDEGMKAVDQAKTILARLPETWRPAVEVGIAENAVRARLLVLADRPAEAIACCDSALAGVDEYDIEFWRGPALNARAMALASLNHESDQEAAQAAFDYQVQHLGIDDSGINNAVQGLCDAAAVLIDVLSRRGRSHEDMERILNIVAPSLERVAPARLAMTAEELVRAIADAGIPLAAHHEALGRLCCQRTVGKAATGCRSL